ncbi:MAG: hypothetical protein J6Y10_00175 [Lachnospiraceae bacterium]|nr:hypothetical protein [Lachnospiraceae bacterium]
MSKNSVKTSKTDNKKSLPVLWRRIIGILCAALVIGIIVSFVTFFKSQSADTISVSLQMSFDGAADGIAPNGYRFDVTELLSDEVLEKALKASAMDSKYTAEELRKCITLSGRYPKDIVNQTMSYDSLLNFTANRELTVDKFHPTQFTITMSNASSSEMTKPQMEKLLKNIMAAYKEYFATVSVMGRPAESEPFDLAEYDYTQQLEIIERRIEILMEYATELYTKEPSFRSNGTGFNDIAVRLNNLVNNDISRISAKLTLNALTKNPERLLSQYRYELKNLNNQLDAQSKVMKLIDEMITAYEKSEILYISSADALTKIDGNSSETYDSLIEARKEIADSNTKLSTRKEDILLKLQDLLGGVDEDVVRNPEYGIANRDETADPDANQGDTASENGSADANGTDSGANAADGNGTDDNNAGDGSGNGADNGNGNGNGTGSGTNPADGKGDGDDQGTGEIDPSNWTDEQILAALAKAAANSSGQRESLEKEISALVSRCDAVTNDFKVMLEDWNAEKINDLTMEVGSYNYTRQGVISMAFIRNGVKRTGPFMALAVIVSLIMIIRANAKDEKTGSEKTASRGERVDASPDGESD